MPQASGARVKVATKRVVVGCRLPDLRGNADHEIQGSNPLMDQLLPAALAMIIGLAGLVWGAHHFVSAAATGAKTLGVSPIVIGLTVVSFGTSAPEVIVAANAALQNSSDLAVGNALGSNIANIGLVLGVTALIAPLPAQRHLVFQEGPALLLVTGLAGLCLYNAFLGRGESALLLAVTPLLLWVTIKYKKQHPDPEDLALAEDIQSTSMATALTWFFIGLGAMLIASKLLVWGAQVTALQLGMSELVIGLTIVAIGTSLPELAASVMSALKGHHDIAVGNVFGSNVFNLLVVMPTAGVIAPLDLDTAVFYRDYTAVSLITIFLFASVALALWRSKKPTAYLSRRLGAVLLIIYSAYMVMLVPSG